MKRILNIATAVALLFGVSTAANAQSVEDKYPYNFFSVQGGAQVTFTNQKITDLITPQAALSFGRYFNSKVGARLHVQAWQIKGALNKQNYKFNAGTADLDLLLNMSNIMCPNRINDCFDWVLLAGFGVNYSWNYDEYNNLFVPGMNPYLCGTKHATYNGRFGTQFNFNLSKAVALGLEIDANYKNDEFNLKRNYNPDWQVAAFLGLTVKFGAPKAKKTTREVTETYYVDEPYTETVKKQRPVETTQQSSMKKVVYYKINVSDVEQAQGIDGAIKEAADLIKTDPNAKITVTGYADKETGTAEINERLSKERAEGVTNKLVNEHGINAGNITTSWKGDTVQPFSVNDENRCVIIEGKGNFKVTKYEEYEEKVEKTRQVEKTRTKIVEE
jgi:outer membrane protein OmpA-like peptidoglycan-associated protein